MIVQPTASSLLLITQPDHAALAARFMRHWRTNGFPDSAHRESILHAIAQHDNGWEDVDAAPLVDAEGRILDFISVPSEVKRAIWPRGVERLDTTPHAAALVAQHGLHIYRRYREDPEWTSFFADLTALRDRYAYRSSIGIDDVVREYFFLRIGDLVSLTFCNGWTGEQIDDSGSGHAIRLDGTQLMISPDPLEGRAVPLAIEAREFPLGPFRSTDAARTAFAQAPRVTLEGVALGATR
jgi:hypothetical protein